MSGYPLFFDSSPSNWPKSNEKSIKLAENAETCAEIARKRFEDELRMVSAQRDRDLKDHYDKIERNQREKERRTEEIKC